MAIAGVLSGILESVAPPKSGSDGTTNKQKRRARGRISAASVIDSDTLLEIKRDYPGWDYDELLKIFDDFLDTNPDELPANYSRRFKGFVAEHDKRQGHILGRYQS